MFVRQQVSSSLIVLTLCVGCGQNMQFAERSKVGATGIELPPDDLPPLTTTSSTSTSTTSTSMSPTTTTQAAPPPPPPPTTSSSSTSTTSTSTSTSSSSSSSSTSSSTTSTTQPRPSITQTFQQGTTNGKVDILFVVDNALSMVDSLRSIADRFSSFLTALQSADWQIGITTTDVSDQIYGFKGSIVPLEGGNGSRFLTPSMTNKESLFAKTLVRPETLSCGFSPQNACASPWVQPIKASQLAIEKRSKENSGFFRAGADLAIITISNKDEMRNGKDHNPTQPEVLLNTFNGAFAASAKRLATFGVVIPSADATCLAEMKRKWRWDPHPGTFQERLSRLTGGDIVSICAQDFGVELSRLGNGIRQLSQSFELRLAPIPGSVRVQIRPAQTIPFVVKDRRVVFGAPPVANSEIVITYEPAP